MHMHPRVRELEERFPDTLSVIGVHAGKFITERITERIAEACDRLDVIHAVVNDRQFRTWRDFAVEAWPTLVIVDTEGYIAAIVPGETPVSVLADEIGRLVDLAQSRGTLRQGPDPAAASLHRHEGPLRFPTRAIVDGRKLWVADTGHGRVLECHWRPGELAAEVIQEHTGFDEPRGLAQFGGLMHVAERRGHRICRLQGRQRTIVAGTGELGDGLIRSGDPERAALRSPWGLAVADGRLTIAMAGAHQLWTLERGHLELAAGSGGEALYDGRAARAALAQPTGVAALSESALAFADCESSAVRMLYADSVSTVVGTDLFEFGDRDGMGDRVQLQHCEDIAWQDAVLAVADTYNDRLKRLDPAKRECAPWLGEAGEKGALREPGGVFSDGATLLVADTGHHRIVSVGPGGTLTELKLV
jgi:hypothetical protein